MAEFITVEMIDELVTGAAFLGTGGGGDPYIGALLCKESLAQHGPVRLMQLEALADDDAVYTAAAMGAPTILIEKLLSVEDADGAVRALERHMGRTATAIIAAEIGGINATLPIAYAAMRGLPIIDGDGMGRAFPALNMTTYNVAGIGCAPLVLSDEFGDYSLVVTRTGLRAEQLARSLVVEFGASATLSCYPMTGAECRRAAVGGSITAALAIGAAILGSGDDVAEPIDRLLAVLDNHPLYGSARRLFDGKITGLQRDTSRGWVLGRCEIESLDGERNAVVAFQNENLSVEIDGVVRAIVPDLITIVDRETAQPIPTEALRYGQRVAVVGCLAPPALRTPEALVVMGPAAFELPGNYTPIDQLDG